MSGSAIPASQIVSVVPSVLPAGGTGLDLNGLIVTTDNHVPLGAVNSYPTLTAVQADFGPVSAVANLAKAYFNADSNATKLPGALLVTCWGNNQWLAGWLMSALLPPNVLSLAQLQAAQVSTITMQIDGITHGGAAGAPTINMSAVPSFSDAAHRIGASLEYKTGIKVGDLVVTDAETGTGAHPTILVVTANTMPDTRGGAAAGAEIPGLPLVVGDCLFGDHFQRGTYILAVGAFDAQGNPIKKKDGTAWPTTGVYTLNLPHNTAGVQTVAPFAIRNPCNWDAQTNQFKISASPALLTYPAPALAGYPSQINIVKPNQLSSVGYITAASGNLINMTKFTKAAGARIQTNGMCQIAGGGFPFTTAGQFMDNVVKVTMDWASFMTSFEPDGIAPAGQPNAGSINNVQKQAFAAWTNSPTNGMKNNFMYVAWDNDGSPIAPNASNSLAQILNTSLSSGTCPIYSPLPPAGVTNNGPILAAFTMGVVAALDFNRLNGRKTLAFRAQTGLTPDITDGGQAFNLEKNFYNYYGIWTTANDKFRFLYPGFVSGPYKWVDSYVNQIWMNNGFQLALMELLTSVGSIPYNQAGYTLIKAACQDVINRAVNFGAIRAGVTLSSAQAAEVNNAAGAQIDGILRTVGYFLQVVDPDPQVRAARGTPVCTFWYMDGGSVQRITLNSVMIQ